MVSLNFAQTYVTMLLFCACSNVKEYPEASILTLIIIQGENGPSFYFFKLEKISLLLLKLSFIFWSCLFLGEESKNHYSLVISQSKN